jgi:hypothetical protein
VRRQSSFASRTVRTRVICSAPFIQAIVSIERKKKKIPNYRSACVCSWSSLDEIVNYKCIENTDQIDCQVVL